MANEPYIMFINNWIVRVKHPVDERSKKIVVLLHGWTGDENSMWIFSSRIPQNYWIFAPRAPHPATPGGYEWTSVIPGNWPGIDSVIPITNQLYEQIQGWKKAFDIEAEKIHIMGFSQGAAIAYTYSILFPSSVEAVICLSGFLPRGAENLISSSGIKEIKYFIAHGTADDIVPVEQAHFASQTLIAKGANVKWCEDNIGHKISPSCFRELDIFF